MTDIAYNIGLYLQNSGFGTLGTDIFVGQIPASENGIYVLRSGGKLNNYIPIEESVVDIYIKDIKSETAISKLEQIKRNIHRMHTVNLSDDFLYTLLVLGDIDDVQRDIEYEKIYKLSVQVIHRDKSLIS